MENKLYKAIAQTVSSLQTCTQWEKDGRGNYAQAIENHRTRLQTLEDCLPAGSGFDRGSSIDLDKSTGDRLVFNTAFHHMDDNGSYTQWTEHTITVEPSLIHDFELTISGRNVNGIKDYIAEHFGYVLCQTAVS